MAAAVATYQAVLAIDKDSVPALNGIGFMLFPSGELAGARLAADRVLTLRPRDADALFLKGLVQYRSEEWRAAVDTWAVFLDVGEFHPAAQMVRPLYEDARKKAALGHEQVTPREAADGEIRASHRHYTQRMSSGRRTRIELV